MPKAALLLSVILLSSLFFNNSYSFLGGDLPEQYSQFNSFNIQEASDIVKLNLTGDKSNPLKRYLIFGSGSSNTINSEIKNHISSIETNDGFFSIAIGSENNISKLKSQGYHVIEDFPLDFHSNDISFGITEVSRIGEIVGSEKVHENFNYTGSGIKIAIVDTGVDFSNPDIQHSLARDENNIPIMLDPDGQGLILTNATFFANIDKDGILRNSTKKLPDNMTSEVYRTKKRRVSRYISGWEWNNSGNC